MKMQSVQSLNKHAPPLPGETIADDFDVVAIVEAGLSISVYPRAKEDCPFNRGNWIIDFKLGGDVKFCLKLPIQMKEEEVLSWLKPLTDKLHFMPTKKDD